MGIVQDLDNGGTEGLHPEGLAMGEVDDAVYGGGVVDVGEVGDGFADQFAGGGFVEVADVEAAGVDQAVVPMGLQVVGMGGAAKEQDPALAVLHDMAEKVERGMDLLVKNAVESFKFINAEQDAFGAIDAVLDFSEPLLQRRKGVASDGFGINGGQIVVAGGAGTGLDLLSKTGDKATRVVSLETLHTHK